MPDMEDELRRHDSKHGPQLQYQSGLERRTASVFLKAVCVDASAATSSAHDTDSFRDVFSRLTGCTGEFFSDSTGRRIPCSSTDRNAKMT